MVFSTVFTMNKLVGTGVTKNRTSELSVNNCSGEEARWLL